MQIDHDYKVGYQVMIKITHIPNIKHHMKVHII